MQLSTFRNKQRDLLGDTNQGSYTFADSQLDGWRDDEVGVLYARGLFKKDTNYGSEPTISSTDPVAIYYTMPTGFRRIDKIQFVESADATEIVGQSYGFDDLERTGFIYIPESKQFGGYKIRYFGQKEYTGVDDTSMKQEVIDVCLYGTVMRALVSEYMKRVEQRSSLAQTRKADAGPGDLAAGLAVVSRLFQDALARALAIQARSVQGIA